MTRAEQDPDSAVGASSRRRSGRTFYFAYALGLAAIVLAGFAPSFYLRGLVPPWSAPLLPLAPEAAIHGVVATAFILALPLQAWLMWTGRRALHLRLGPWVFVLGVLLLPLTYLAAASTYHVPGGQPQPARAMAAGITLLHLPVMALLLWLGWRNRFNGPAHKRLMIGLVCLMLEPALGRLMGPIASWEFQSLGVLVGSIAITVQLLVPGLPLWIGDWRTERRIHWATRTSSGVYLALLLVRLPIVTMPAWASVVVALPGYGTP